MCKINKDLLFEYVFVEKLTCKEVTEKFGITKSALSYALNKYFPKEYENYKQQKKMNNKKKRSANNKMRIQKFLDEKAEKLPPVILSEWDLIWKNGEYQNMMLLQKQNAISMSKSNKIGDVAMTKWNLQEYSVNNKGKLFLDTKKQYHMPIDMPLYESQKCINVNVEEYRITSEKRESAVEKSVIANQHKIYDSANEI